MTDPTDFLEPEPEPELEPVPEPFISMSTVLRNVPYVAALALAIFGVAYNNFSGHPINGYWEFLAIAMALVCVATGWPNAPERKARFHLLWTQVAHWVTILVAMNLVLLPGFQQVLPVQAAGLVLLMLLGVGDLSRRHQSDVAPDLLSRRGNGVLHSSHDLAQTGVAIAGLGRRRDCRHRRRLLAAGQEEDGLTGGASRAGSRGSPLESLGFLVSR